MLFGRKKKKKQAKQAQEAAASKKGPLDKTIEEWVREKLEEDYWFHKLELAPGLVTPGWSDPRVEKLPHFHLPEDCTGMRVLDIGCAEGFFSFEAERRGAEEVVAVDSNPTGIEHFNVCKAALGSKANAYLCNVYDLSPRTYGTFDLVLFYGVLYHLRHPILALEKIRSVCSGTMLLQTKCREEEAFTDEPMAFFHPFGIDSGPDEDGNPLRDPTVFWIPNRAAVRAMAEHVGFANIETLSEEPSISILLKAESPEKSKGEAPDEYSAPWS